MSNASKDGGPAFAFSYIDLTKPGMRGTIVSHGMTMRQYYKAAALQGWAAGRNNGNVFMDMSEPSRVADACGRYADHMLAEDEEHAKK